MSDSPTIPPDSAGKDFGLTQVEKRALALFMGGSLSEETEGRTGIGESSLRKSINRICNKLNLSNEFELILFALHHRLLDKHESPPPSD
jgi:DNA-binding CsgD family transcriptional regulator